MPSMWPRQAARETDDREQHCDQWGDKDEKEIAREVIKHMNRWAMDEGRPKIGCGHARNEVSRVNAVAIGHFRCPNLPP